MPVPRNAAHYQPVEGPGGAPPGAGRGRAAARLSSPAPYSAPAPGRAAQRCRMSSEHILIVDDEPAIQATLRGGLEDKGYRVTAVGSCADALRVVADEPPDLTFLDIWMERMDGLETLAEIKRLRPDALVVMISGHGTIETAVKATKLGAYDFIEKPLSLEKTLLTVTQALV